MRVLVLGADGYLGWPTSMYFAARGHEVVATDSYAKRKWEAETGAMPLLAVPTLEERVGIWNAEGRGTIDVVIGDLTDADFVHDLISTTQPDAIVHYGEQCSAPYSMMSQEAGVSSQVNNLVGNLNVLYAMRDHAPGSHLVKLGTMGEYGTPNIDIEEGYIEIAHKGRRDVLPFPKRPGSVYHLSKVHDSHNIEFACRIWRLRATDLHQGVVYGLRTPEMGDREEFATSFRYDEVFGTVLNRFLVQALAGHPLTVYGAGGQTRGYLNILDTLACVELSALNPPEAGDYRVFNQFTEQFSVIELAHRVQSAAKRLGIEVEISHIDNPRVESESHYYNATHTKLVELGLEPHLLSEDFIVECLQALSGLRSRISEGLFLRGVTWQPAVRAGL
jgi:UDP-sulfoquinovose synthase